MVELCASIRSTSRDSTSGQIVLSVRLAMSGTGTCTFSSKRLADGGATMVVRVVGPPQDRNRASFSGGRTVADNPMRCAGARPTGVQPLQRHRYVGGRAYRWRWRGSRRRSRSGPRPSSRAAEVSIRNSDSGVVISTSGGELTSWRRCCGGVSPERTPTLMPGGGRPWRSAIRVKTASGVRRLRSTSTASTLNGDTYNTRVPAGRSPAAARLSSAHKTPRGSCRIWSAR